MVKGMTRRIVEIKQPGNSYFEKVVFYCRTNMPKPATDSTLTQEACRIIDKLCVDTQLKLQPFRRSRLTDILKIAVSIAAGAVSAVVFFRLRF